MSLFFSSDKTERIEITWAYLLLSQTEHTQIEVFRTSFLRDIDKNNIYAYFVALQ